MVQIAALLLGFPAGWFIRPRRRAFVALAVVLGLVLVPQTIGVSNDGHLDAVSDHLVYWPVQAVSLAVACGLAVWGARVAARRGRSAGASTVR